MDGENVARGEQVQLALCDGNAARGEGWIIGNLLVYLCLGEVRGPSEDVDAEREGSDSGDTKAQSSETEQAECLAPYKGVQGEVGDPPRSASD